jgi:hypothetical protein
MATPKTNSNPFSAQSANQLINLNQNTCPHAIPMCPVCIATDELLIIFRAPKPRLFSLFRFGGAR